MQWRSRTPQRNLHLSAQVGRGGIMVRRRRQIKGRHKQRSGVSICWAAGDRPHWWTKLSPTVTYAPTGWGSNKCFLLFSATSNTPASPRLESQSSADTNSILAFMCCRLQALHQAINGGGLGAEWALRPLSTEPEELRQRKSTPTSKPFCTLSGELPHYFVSAWFRLHPCIFFSRSRAFNSHQAVPSHYTIILNGFPSSLLCKALNCVLDVVANVKFTVIQIAPLLKQLSKLEFMNIRGNISFHLCRYLTA